MDRPGPIWPPDELLGDDPDDGWVIVDSPGPWAGAPVTDASGPDASGPPMDRVAATTAVPASPWAQPPQAWRLTADPTAIAASPAPGVYDVPATVEPLSRFTMHQVTVISRNANARRAVSRLLTITLQHNDPDLWDRAAALVRDDDLDMAHIVDRLARDQAISVVDAGPDVRSPEWERAVAAANQIVVAVSAAGSGPAEEMDLIDTLSRLPYAAVASRLITVVLLPVSRFGLTRGHEDAGALRRYFEPVSRSVFLAAFDLRPTTASHSVWCEVAAAVRADIPAATSRH